jgi:hypothetical protein
MLPQRIVPESRPVLTPPLEGGTRPKERGRKAKLPIPGCLLTVEMVET